MLPKLNLKVYSMTAAKEIVKALKKSDVKELKGNGRFKVIASCESIDRDGEIIMVDGWDFSNYVKNPVILWGHNYWDMNAIIGACDKIAIEEIEGVKCLVQEGIFANTEEGQKARQLYDDGMLKTVSVGFIPKERNGNIITKQELLETSFCAVPSNPDAVSLEKLAKGMMTRTLAILKNKKEIKTMDMETLIQDLRNDLQMAVDDFVEDMSDGGADEGNEGETEETDSAKRVANIIIKELNLKFAKAKSETTESSVPSSPSIPADDKEKAKQIELLEAKIAALEAETKSGRVLSEKNRTLVKTCIDTLTELHAASEPEKALGGVAKELQLDLQSFVKMVEKSIKNAKLLSTNL